MSGAGITANQNNTFGGVNEFKQPVTLHRGDKLARVSVFADKELSQADVGVIQNVSASDKATSISIHLPAVSESIGSRVRVAVSMSFTGGATCTVAPAATERILPATTGVPYTATDIGSALVLLGTPQGWVRESVSGTWS